MSNRSVILAAGVALAMGLPAIDAAAAPQVLGLVASNGVPTELDCSGIACTAHFSSFCLQQNRPAPSHGQAYVVAAGSGVTLVARNAAGETLRVPGEQHLQFTSLIGFTSVQISLPKVMLGELGAVEVAVEVGPSVSLLPAPEAGDTNPQSDDEVALATGPMREAASSIFEQPNPASDAARIASVVINALPSRGIESAELRDRLWADLQSSPVVAMATPAGLERAGMLFESCRISVESRSTYSMRNCLELRHADLLAETNHRFWRETAGY